jgi:hypothetical protein
MSFLETLQHSPGTWSARGRLGSDEGAPVGMLMPYNQEADSISRTAVYVTRMHGGVGGGGPVRASLSRFGAGRVEIQGRTVNLSHVDNLQGEIGRRKREWRKKEAPKS